MSNPLADLARHGIPDLAIDAAEFAATPRNKRLAYIVRRYFTSGNTAIRSTLLTNVVHFMSSIMETTFPNTAVGMYGRTLGNCTQLLTMLPVVRDLLSVSSDDGGPTRDGQSDRFRQAMSLKYGFPAWGDMTEGQTMKERIVFDNIEQARTVLGVSHWEVSEEPKIKIAVGTYEGIRYGAMVTASPGIFSTSRMFYTTVVLTENRGDADRMYDAISKACLDVFARSINPTRNYVICDDGGFQNVEKQRTFRAGVNNLPHEEIRAIVGDAIERNYKTSIMLVGDPGQGKSTTLHRIMLDFPNTPCVWFRPSHVMLGLDYVYSIIAALGMCILIFDDLEGCGVRDKDDTMTTELVSRFDDNSGIVAVILSTVNEPKLVHASIKRSRRFGDHVFLAEYPDVTSVQAIVADISNIALCDSDAKCVVTAKMTVADVAALADDIRRYAVQSGATVMNSEVVKTLVDRKSQARALLRSTSDDGLLDLESGREKKRGAKLGDNPAPLRRR